MSNILRYFFPKRRLYLVPKHISARYERGEISKEQAIILMAGLARDPEHALTVLGELRAKHGDKVWDIINFDPRRKRSSTIGERFMMLMRRIFGENEHDSIERVNKKEAIVAMDYAFKTKKSR